MSRGRARWATHAVLMAIALSLFAAATARAKDPNAPAAKKEIKPQVTAKPQAVAKPPVPVSLSAAPPKRTPASFTRDMPFGEAIDILKNCTTPPLNIVVLWNQVEENAGIYRDTPIGMDGVSGLRVRQCLELLLLAVSGGSTTKLGYVVHNGVVTVGTADGLPAPKRVARIYDIGDLVAPPSQASLMPMGMGMGMGFGPMSYGGMGNPGMGYGNMGYGNMGYGNMGSPYGGGLGTGYLGPVGQPRPYGVR